MSNERGKFANVEYISPSAFPSENIRINLKDCGFFFLPDRSIVKPLVKIRTSPRGGMQNIDLPYVMTTEIERTMDAEVNRGASTGVYFLVPASTQRLELRMKMYDALKSPPVSSAKTPPQSGPIDLGAYRQQRSGKPSNLAAELALLDKKLAVDFLERYQDQLEETQLDTSQVQKLYLKVYVV